MSILEDLEAAWDHAAGRLLDHGQPAPAAVPAFTPHDQPSQQVSSSQPEVPVSLSDELTALTALATRLDALGEDAVAKLETVKANPDGARAFEAAAALSARGQLSAAASAVVSALEALAQQP